MNFDAVIRETLQQMKDGDSNWQMPWHGRQIVPLNVARGTPYSGINRVILWAQYRKHNWSDRYWGTLRQWQARGQMVAMGARGTTLVMPVIRPGSAGEDELIGFRRFWVFNGDQVRNRDINHPDLFGHSVVDVPDVEAFIRTSRARIQHGSNVARYLPPEDRIEVPHKEDFFHTATSTATQNYYSTLLHELVHWTGHHSREDRNVDLGSRAVSYAFEELVAEIGAAFLCADFQIEDIPRKDHAQYLNSWIKLIGDKSTWFWRACSLAQQAVNYLGRIAPKEPEFDVSTPDWFRPEQVQMDLLAPELLGTGHGRR